VVGKVISVGKTKVYYSTPPDTATKNISKWRLAYIRYAGGTLLVLHSAEEIKNRIRAQNSKSEFYMSVDAGFTVPSISYKDAIVGTYFGLKATYYFNANVGISVKAGEDLNGTGLNYISSSYWGGFYTFQQFLGGITYRTGGKPNYPWVDFVGLVGYCNANSPVSETGNGNTVITVNTPGSGSGFGFYIGLDFTSSESHLCSVTFGVACMGGFFSYPNYSSTLSQYDPYTRETNTTIAKSTNKTELLLPQMYLAINLKLKKAGQ
jgi:hypothetical protein